MGVMLNSPGFGFVWTLDGSPPSTGLIYYCNGMKSVAKFPIQNIHETVSTPLY